MTVAELRTELLKFDQQAEVHYPSDTGFGWSVEINEAYASTATYGLLVPPEKGGPTTVKTVVLCTGSEDL